MQLYDKDKVAYKMAEAGAMFARELPKMFGYILLFYAMLGFGISWRMEVPLDDLWNSVKASLIFGSIQGGIILVIGAFFMNIYALQKTLYTDFVLASSLTMLWSFRIFGAVGVPLAFWDIFRIVLPEFGSLGEEFALNWWMWLLLVGGVCGWFSGRSVGGLIGLLSIWLAGKRLLTKL